MGLTIGQEKAVTLLGDWYHDNRPGYEIATLEGFAGTGKTWLTKYLIKMLGIRKVAVTAPTNRAKTVIQQATGLKGKTVHSMLGLQPNMDLASFSPKNLNFEPINPINMDEDLIVVDEASMINKELYKEICEAARLKKKKVLFMGDRYQLPPINEKVSDVFVDPYYRATLDEIVRQGNNNPNSELILTAINDIRTNRDDVDRLIVEKSQNISPETLNESKGFIHVPNSAYSAKDFFQADKNNFLRNRTKYLAYTNNSVGKTVDNLRASVFGFKDVFNVGESLVGYRGITEKIGKQFVAHVVNSEDYLILDVVPMEFIDGMQGFQLLVENIYTQSHSYFNMINTFDVETKVIYDRIVARLIRTAKENYGKMHWAKYYKFVNKYFAMTGVYDEMGGEVKEVKAKDLYYSYGITVHKSQGGTFKNSFINLANLNRCYKANERRSLKYVALSRASDVNVIF